jgi:hypothetical protein
MGLKLIQARRNKVNKNTNYNEAIAALKLQLEGQQRANQTECARQTANILGRLQRRMARKAVIPGGDAMKNMVTKKVKLTKKKRQKHDKA